MNHALDTATHYTISNLFITEEKQYGFAVDAEGNSIYIPGGMIKHKGLTMSNLYDGFRALTKRANPEDEMPHVFGVMMMDEEAQAAGIIQRLDGIESCLINILQILEEEE